MPTGMLIGRDRELDELEQRISTHRLVTVVGPGGVGKTALARAVAERVGTNYLLGVRHVDLTPMADRNAVVGNLAAQLGFDSFDALLSSPNDRPVLLVVDNCEHVLDAVAAALVQVLGACRQPTILSTSRAPLELAGESVVALAPLALPTADRDAATSPSVQLFLQRCRDAGATVPDADLPVVAELCQRLDGLPLALEIAAARARTMTMAEISARVAEGIDVLDRPRFRGDPRHRSLSEMLGWSYDLLPLRQATLLDRLAVFVGPFTGADAAALVDDDERDGLDDDIDALVTTSLLAVDTTGPATRYRLLDTVRRYALARLRRRNDDAATYDRFVDHVVATTRRTLAGAPVPWDPALVRDLFAAYDDIAEALRYAIAHDAAPFRAHQLCAALVGVVHQGHADEIAELCRQTLRRWPDDASAAGAQAVATLATAEYTTGHPDRAAELATAVLRRPTTQGPASITLRRVLGQSQRALGELVDAGETFRAGARVGHELGMTAVALELEIADALVAADLGDVDRAVEALHGLLDRADAIDSAITSSWARTTLGWVLLRRDPVAARVAIDDALDRARRIDDAVAIAVGLRSRAYAALLTGDHGAAVSAGIELVDELMDRGALSNARLLLDVTAVIAEHLGHPSWEVLVATARSLPITTSASAHYELVPLPATTAARVPRHDAVGMARNVLTELVSGQLETAAGPHASATAELRRIGEMCELRYASRTVTVRTSKGIADLIRLIEANGRELHCLDLAESWVDQTSLGEVIDPTARRRYEDRIRDLQSELDEAEANSDFERAYRHQVELDALIEHLAAALGHGGRTRRATDSAERARSAVTHRVRSAIRQIEKLHPQLGRHLSNAVSTGTYCSYRPEQEIAWHIH